MENKTRFTAISDFHGILPDIEETDVLIIAGDISPFKIQGNRKAMREWLETDFKNWLMLLPVYKVILVPGNHDFIFDNMTKKKIEDYETLFEDKLKILKNNFYELDFFGQKYNIFGTPYCHIYGNWPFMRSEEILKEKYKEIPSGLDILITHDPVYGISDTDIILKPRYKTQAHFSNVGNQALYYRLLEMYDNDEQVPKYIISGHIHSGEHKLKEVPFGESQTIQMANVSLMCEDCQSLVYKPLQFEL